MTEIANFDRTLTYIKEYFKAKKKFKKKVLPYLLQHSMRKICLHQFRVISLITDKMKLLAVDCR